MPLMKTIAERKVNIKFTPKNVITNSNFKLQTDSEVGLCESRLPMIRKSELNAQKKQPVLSGCSKRKPELVEDVHSQKRWKMDRSVKLQCGLILKVLLGHPYAWVFAKPVDPVALNIPDYFDIIADPMDLGTIKSKLENNKYYSAEEFASDVKLTFSNAMLYNPPSNDVHCMAQQLDSIFQRKWKLLEATCNSEITSVQQRIVKDGSGKNTQAMEKTCNKKSQLDVTPVVKNSMPLEERQKLRKELMDILKGKMPEKLHSVLKKFNFVGLKEGKMKLDITTFDDATLQELKRVVKGFVAESSAKAMPAKTTKNCGRPLSGKVLHKGASVNGKPPVNSISSICCSCETMRCQCERQTSNALASTNEKSLEVRCHAAKVDTRAKLASAHASLSDWDSDGSGSLLDEEKTLTSPSLSPPITAAVPGEGWTPISDDQWSLKRAQRAAMLRSRFAETILKANGFKTDPRKVQLEREKLERLQRQEEAIIKARIEEENLKLKMQREKDREAARAALERMERTVEVDDNLKFLRELEMLSQCSASDILSLISSSERAIDTSKISSPLELLGVHMKEDYIVDDEEAILCEEREEGEI